MYLTRQLVAFQHASSTWKLKSQRYRCFRPWKYFNWSAPILALKTFILKAKQHFTTASDVFFMNDQFCTNYDYENCFASDKTFFPSVLNLLLIEKRVSRNTLSAIRRSTFSHLLGCYCGKVQLSSFQLFLIQGACFESRCVPSLGFDLSLCKALRETRFTVFKVRHQIQIYI